MFNSKKKLRAAFHDPYLDSVGGGERYVLTIAQALVKNGWQVDLQWQNNKIIKWTEERLGLDLSGIEIVDDISKGAGYDLVFWLSDGSVPLLFANKNLIHFQTPFQNVQGKNILNKLKFLKVTKIICNSQFTKKFIDAEFGVKSVVLYPPVPTDDIRPGKKENIILSVGRFSQLQQSKRQDVLVDTFIQMCKRGLKGWKLILIGGSDIGRGDFVDNLKKTSLGYPIHILENLPFDEMVKYYSKAKIFWSASGFNIDEEKEPFKVEHFGITVVEAMSAGAVPIVVNKGGHKEIIQNTKNGYLWDSVDDLVNLTKTIISEPKKMVKISDQARLDANIFSESNFQSNFLKILDE